MENFWNQTVPNWTMAIAALWGVFEIIRGYFKLRRQQKDNERDVERLDEELNEIRKQTTQFEYQTSIMSENNRILENGIENLIGILGHGQEAEEQRIEIERQRRIIDIRPNFVFSGSSSNPTSFRMRLRNQGSTASTLRLIDVSNDSIIVNPLNENAEIERGQDLQVTGRPGQGYNANLATGQILIGYTDIDGNQYQQNIIKNRGGYQIGLPEMAVN